LPVGHSSRAMRRTTGRPAWGGPTSPSRRNFFRGLAKSASIECGDSFRFADAGMVTAQPDAR